MDIETPIKLMNCTFEWNQQTDEESLKTFFYEHKPKSRVGCITDINLQIKRGELVCVVGSVGSGKSSLIQAIIGEMPKVSGRVSITGDIAYCPQTVSNFTKL